MICVVTVFVPVFETIFTMKGVYDDTFIKSSGTLEKANFNMVSKPECRHRCSYLATHSHKEQPIPNTIFD